MGTWRKYLMNPAIVSSLVSGVSAYRQQRRSTSDWRTYATWAAWIISLAVAIGTIRIESADEDPSKPARSGDKPFRPNLRSPNSKK